MKHENSARVISSQRLDLIGASEATLRADLESHESLARVLGVFVPASWPPELYDADAIRWSLDWMARHPWEHAWSFYYVTLRMRSNERVLIGASGYKGAPSTEGSVEVGYGVLPEYQRQGFASEAASALVTHAFDDARVREVIAHTLPELVASIGVLDRNAFLFAG